MITLPKTPWPSRDDLAELESRLNFVLSEFEALAERVNQLERQQSSISSLLDLLNKSKGGEPTTRTDNPASEATKLDNGNANVGRGGWRGKAQSMSASTFPAPSDSVAKLQERVIKEGGVI